MSGVEKIDIEGAIIHRDEAKEVIGRINRTSQ